MNGTCRNCGKRREVRSARRFGGGNYRRPGRYYSSSICQECAHDLLTNYPPNRGQSTISRWDVLSLRRAWPLTNHEHEPWQIRLHSAGGLYCAACGADAAKASL